MLGAGTRTEVVDALAGCSAEGAEATLRATGGVAVALRDPATWQASAPGAAVASEPWIRFALLPWRNHAPSHAGQCER